MKKAGNAPKTGSRAAKWPKRDQERALKKVSFASNSIKVEKP